MTTLRGGAGLRIHFTAQDLVRTRISTRPDTLWELVLSLLRLQTLRPSGRLSPPVPPDVIEWRASTLSRLSGRALGQALNHHVLPLTPVSSYFPDFLTPGTGLADLAPGLDMVLSTPRERIGQELGILTTRSGTPSWGADLAAGNRDALHLLGATLRSYHATALAPCWPAITARIAAERTRLTGVLTTSGAEGSLSALRPFAEWHPTERILEARYPVAMDIHLQGRGLTLIPSWFCHATPVALADPALPPVLIYPITHDPPPAIDPAALTKLIGPTRAKVLTTITTGTPTSLIQHRTGISASQISRHAAVLRDNNLITEARHAGHTFYTRTPLGHVLTAGH
ncbi:winged helix-turn-helix domain-containing protein [Amycolatopsis speibonae]|uniref:Winged helix-turn-helix domain-containing protein n=1 Tax=Amycolatopsis speibonae TaxID=1450224 RepID=A0ABV7PA17_9PSEU